MAVVLKCPSCEEKFRWDFAEQSKWPKACPACGVSMGEEVPDDVIMMPALRSAKMNVIDGSYRELESSSQARAEQAAEAAGCSVSEMSGLKITDIKTGVKPGESYVADVNNVVTQQMEVMKARGGQVGFAGAEAAEFASQVKTGPYPNAGASVLSRVQRLNGRG